MQVFTAVVAVGFWVVAMWGVAVAARLLWDAIREREALLVAGCRCDRRGSRGCRCALRVLDGWRLNDEV